VHNFSEWHAYTTSWLAGVENKITIRVDDHLHWHFVKLLLWPVALACVIHNYFDGQCRLLDKMDSYLKKDMGAFADTSSTHSDTDASTGAINLSSPTS
jgi:hypothetical protein